MKFAFNAVQRSALGVCVVVALAMSWPVSTAYAHSVYPGDLPSNVWAYPASGGVCRGCVNSEVTHWGTYDPRDYNAWVSVWSNSNCTGSYGTALMQGRVEAWDDWDWDYEAEYCGDSGWVTASQDYSWFGVGGEYCAWTETIGRFQYGFAQGKWYSIDCLCWKQHSGFLVYSEEHGW